MADISHITIPDGTTYDIKDPTARVVMSGATSSTAGTQGQVPAPSAGDEEKFLRGDGSWIAVSGGSGGGATSITTSLSAANWSDGSQTVTVAGITSDTDGIIGLAISATLAQREAARDAELVITAQATDSITVTADGTVPSVDLPITVMFWAESESEQTVTFASWADGTDEEIDALLTAAQAGEVNLYEDAGWRVGDERQVTLSAMAATGVGESHVAQTVTMVLVNQGGKYTSDGTECNFIMQPKNALANGTTAEEGYINSSNTNSGGWTSCARRTWCNNVYYNALPDYIKNHVLSVANSTSAGNGSTTINTVYDYCALPSCIEVGLLTTTSPYNSEGSQWSYYTDDASRIKHAGDSGTIALGWWSRSPNASASSGYTWYMLFSSTADTYTASTDAALAPFCCI